VGTTPDNTSTVTTEVPFPILHLLGEGIFVQEDSTTGISLWLCIVQWSNAGVGSSGLDRESGSCWLSAGSQSLYIIPSTTVVYRWVFTYMAEYTINDLYVKKVPMDVGREFIMEHHYSGGCGVAAMTWGLFEEVNDEMVGAIAFQTPCSENVRESIFGDDVCHCDLVDGEHTYKSHVTELHRLVTLDETPHNTESWFISRALDRLKEYKPKYWGIVSFADETEGHVGTIYQATNALYYGMSGSSTFYRDEKGRLRHPRQVGENITIGEAREREWEPERRDGKHRYLFLLDDTVRSRDDLVGELEIETEPYPDKGAAVSGTVSVE